MASKWYKAQKRYRQIKFHGSFGPVMILSRPTEVSDENLQKKIEGCRDFGSSVVLCDPPGVKAAVEEEEEEIEPLDDGKLSYGLYELKDMHVAKLRAVAKRASVWHKGMTREEMIEALIGG